MKQEQAEINIGFIGHVDHGKCIALDEPILLNNDFCTGANLVSEKCMQIKPEVISESERLFNLPNLRAFSLGPDFEIVSVPAKVFTQNYSGPMFEVVTYDGKRIKASPEHPLLVHNGLEIAWKKAKELKTADFVGALKQIPQTAVLKDPFPEWLTELEKTCWVISKKRAEELENKTNKFSEFDRLSVSELNEIRILKKISVASLEKSCKAQPGFYSACFKKGILSESHRRKIGSFFKSGRTINPKGLTINYKNNSKSFVESGNHGFDDELLKFLAFIIAEGHLTENSIRIAQSKNLLLKQVFNFCEQNFGIKPKYYGRFDYHINSKALVLFLKTRYGIKTGASRKAGIPAWVFSLPNEKLAVFLREFFSAEGTVNKKSCQVSLVQANRGSVCLIGYALKKFGIGHSIHPIKKMATNTRLKIKREYWQISISDLKNIILFKEKIGFSLAEKNKKLEKLCSRKPKGKQTNKMIPIDSQLLSELIGLLALKKKRFSGQSISLKQRKWFYAYQDCRCKNTASEEKLEEITLFLEKRLREMKNASNKEMKPEFLSEWGISQKDISIASGLSEKKVFSTLNCKTKKEIKMRKKIIAESITQIIEKRSQKAADLLEKIVSNNPKNIEWCRIKSIEKQEYAGPIIDLQVPGYHNFICGTGALISHNTSLVKALSGKWTDTHSEEIKKGISIRLGYADVTFYKCAKEKGSEQYCTGEKCPLCESKTAALRKVSFVDAPGHETLMATMLSGAALMQGAVLVIAANEKCPQPRTEEHLMALSISGVKKIVVAQNKVDLVSLDAAKENFMQIKNFLKAYGFEEAPVIPVSANKNLNIDALIQAIEETIPTPSKDDKKNPKMHIVRSFDINKPGSDPLKLKGGVMGGSLECGKLKLGDEIEISPGLKGKPVYTKIESLAIEGAQLKEAFPGGLIAVGTLLDPNHTRNDQMRGQVIGLKGKLPLPSKEMTVEVHKLKRMINVKEQEIKLNDAVVLTVGTMTAVGIVAKISNGIAQIILKNEVVYEKGQRVAISKRDESHWSLAAYGIAK